jgi:hypothetical protein
MKRMKNEFVTKRKWNQIMHVDQTLYKNQMSMD